MSSSFWTLVCVAVLSFRVTRAADTKWEDATDVDNPADSGSPYSEVGVLVFRNEAISGQEACTGSVVKSGYDTTARSQFIDVLTAAHCVLMEHNGRATKSTHLMYYQGLSEQRPLTDAYNQAEGINPTHTKQIGDFQIPFGFTGLHQNIQQIKQDDSNDVAIVRFEGTSTSTRTLQIGFDATAMNAKVAYQLRSVTYQFLTMDDNGVTNTLNQVGLTMSKFEDVKTVKRTAEGLMDAKTFTMKGMSGSPLLKMSDNAIIGVLNGEVEYSTTCFRWCGTGSGDLWVRFDENRMNTLATALTTNVGAPPAGAHESMYDELETDEQNGMALVNALIVLYIYIELMLIVLSVLSICCFVGGFVRAFADASQLKRDIKISF